MNAFTLILCSLKRRAGRMALLLVGLTASVAIVVSLLSLSSTMGTNISHAMDEYGANILIVPGDENVTLDYGGMHISELSAAHEGLSNSDVEKIYRIKNSRNIRVAAPKLFHAARSGENRIITAGVIFEREFAIKKWWSITGSKPAQKDEAIVGSALAKRLGLGRGSVVRVRDRDLTVSGLLHSTGSSDDDMLFLDLTEAQNLFGKATRLSMIEVSALCSDCPIEEIVRQTSEQLPTASVKAVKATLELKAETLRTFERYSYGISAAILLVASLIVWTNVSAVVSERRKEIGIFRAIGFRTREIMMSVLGEIVLASGLAGAVGSLIGLLTSELIGRSLGFGHSQAVLLTPFISGLSVLLTSALGLLSGLWPANRASRMEPSAALRTL